MFTFTGIIMMLFVLAVICAVVYGLFWCVDAFPFGPPAIKQIAKIIIVLGAILLALQHFGVLGG